MRFPLNDVTVRRVSVTKSVTSPVYSDSNWQMNQSEFAMQVKGLADFYAFDGREVEYSPEEGADPNSIELYMNGSVYGAILHQRLILPFHGSSFIYNDSAVMICGDAGAGKSSLTASFCLNGAEFLSDDVTPVIFRDGIPYVHSLSDRLKLWGDALSQLNMEKGMLESIFPGTDKYFYPMRTAGDEMRKLTHLFIIEIIETGQTTFTETFGAGKFSVLRNEIYRPEYLQGMKENEPVYFKNIMDICENVKVIRIKRRQNIKIAELHKSVEEFLEGDIKSVL